MRVGIVTEGTSDFLVLAAIVESIQPGSETMALWPDTAASGRPFGWRGVKSWCEEHGNRLETLMRGVPGRELDLLVVHVDCSMADKVGARRPCPPARDTSDGLRSVILDTWIGRADLAWIVTTTPSLTTDTWVIAALEPAYRPVGELECDLGVEAELVRRKLLRRKGARVAKPGTVYRRLSGEVAARLDSVRSRCPEAERFCREVLRAAETVNPR